MKKYDEYNLQDFWYIILPKLIEASSEKEGNRTKKMHEKRMWLYKLKRKFQKLALNYESWRLNAQDTLLGNI